MIVLASKSPRRKELLSKLVDEFVIYPSNIDESKYQPEELSLKKAEALGEHFPEDLIISADTLVYYLDQQFGKPRNEQEAFAMLSTLSSKMHQVKTFYTLYSLKKNISITKVIISDVYFNELSPELISLYIATGSPFDKAGGYGIQDQDFNLIDHIEGSYYNVMGLPIEDLKKELIALGINLKDQ